MNKISPKKPRHLFRSRTHRLIGGVCGGLAEYFNIDPTIMRIITLLLTIFGGITIVIYIILWIITPESPML